MLDLSFLKWNLYCQYYDDCKNYNFAYVIIIFIAFLLFYSFLMNLFCTVGLGFISWLLLFVFISYSLFSAS